MTVGEKKILRIDVPAADRHDKPVYIGTDPMKGTYKRDYEGDFLCTEEAVRAMFADQRDVSGDVEVLDEFGLDVLNQDTIKGYRIIFEQLHSGHPWNALENDEFLMKLRAAAKNKAGTLSPTIAGLLFFGEAYHITEVFPNYFLDYREECDDKAVRWLFRTHSNEGDWSGNIYDFFCKVRTRMDDDVAVPFANRRNGYRVDRVDRLYDLIEKYNIFPVIYSNQMPQISDIRNAEESALYQSILTKCEDWSYELEWRIIDIDESKEGCNGKLISFEKPISIYMGVRQGRTEKKNSKQYRDIRVYDNAMSACEAYSSEEFYVDINTIINYKNQENIDLYDFALCKDRFDLVPRSYKRVK